MINVLAEEVKEQWKSKIKGGGGRWSTSVASAPAAVASLALTH